MSIAASAECDRTEKLKLVYAKEIMFKHNDTVNESKRTLARLFSVDVNILDA